MAAKKTKAGSSVLKTEALSIRIDPRLRYGLELLARQQRRSVTGVVEWAVDQALNTEAVLTSGSKYSFSEIVRKLWSPNEFERIVNLGANFPDLMTFEESRMWRVIKETEDLWERGGFKDDDVSTYKNEIVLDQWEKLRPLIVQASERPVVKGLSARELDNGGIVDVPF